ncbi:MAG: precorrin-6y C5,15-methyltransferase (decarboxylating) subunit CbiE [Alphaproteobacteria bacterium GM202ARS2]|nr:precorrin-6y C5,15-methyltransferase (decarboxylating) subunit CbiE [Alphaproteobacteria bacterium GM202ARS2]
MTSTPQPWLTVVGITLEGFAALHPRARKALETATSIRASARQIELLPASLHARCQTWNVPLTDDIRALAKKRPPQTCVLATGDPLAYGIATTLLRHIPLEDMMILPQLSSFASARARLGWSVQETTHVSLHGRNPQHLYAQLAPKNKLLTLCDKHSLALVLTALKQCCLAHSRLTCLANLDSPEESVRTFTAQKAPSGIPPLSLLAIDCAESFSPSPPVALLSSPAALPDDAFHHDGTITKQSIRSLTLMALMPLARQTLWDIGSGCGTVALEWARLVPLGSSFAIERDKKRCQYIKKNKDSLHIDNVHLIEGQAPEAFASLPRPDAIFFGGGIAQATLTRAWQHLAPQGRMVANAVTLESQHTLLQAHQRYGGTLEQWHHAPCHKISPSYHAFHPQRSLVQWRAHKP